MAAKKKAKEPVFWADQLALQITNRKKFNYVDKPAPKLGRFVVKTATSASGVFHIGRMSDVVRGESVVRALKDAGKKADFVWVMDDMDPLRKVPKGVPESFTQHIGVPVTDVPDPAGCHESYAEHHMTRFREVMDRFVSVPMKVFSMREEYRKGHFKPYIKKILENVKIVTEINQKNRTTPIPKGWAPWKPVCKKCGKIITTHVHKIDSDKPEVHYVCEDYSFQKTTAKGCGFKGIANPLKDEGKLLYKSEWAAQWARWKIVAEGAGKEYQVPGSAFWINTEIVEKVLGWPAPFPIFYEHLIIEGKKMSASLGNVIYPSDWLGVAPAELLRYFYNKRLMKTRSFSWSYLPELYHEYDEAARIYSGRYKVANKKEEEHVKRLYEISQLGKKPQPSNPLPFKHAATLVQAVTDEKKILDAIKRTGHFEPHMRASILQRVAEARAWIEKYAPPEAKFNVHEKIQREIRERLSQKQLSSLLALVTMLENRDYTEEELHTAMKALAEKEGLAPLDFYRAAYSALLNKDRGPNLANFILVLGQERVASILRTLETKV